MRGLVKYDLGRAGMEIREVPEPSPKAGDIKIAVKAAGICGSDIHSMNDERKCNMPVILGHEFVGVISELGEGVTDFKVGDWVVAIPAVGNCGKCYFCKKGEYTMCDERASFGTHRDGAMANFLVIPAKFAFKVPDEVEDKMSMAAAEPFTCCVHGMMEKVHITPGDVVVISGPGIMGISCAMVAHAVGAKVIMSGLPQDKERLETAVKLGADDYATSFEELQAKVKALNPMGADIAVECATVVPSVQNCIKILRKQGQFLQVGVFSKDVPIDMGEVLHKELIVTGTNSTTMKAWGYTMQFLKEKKFALTPLVSAQFPLEEWEKGFDLTMSKTAFRVLLIP